MEQYTAWAKVPENLKTKTQLAGLGLKPAKDHDPQYHQGTIYKATNALPMYKNGQQQPIPGPSGKYGWCWRLPEPEWGWWEIPILQPRTMRPPL